MTATEKIKYMLTHDHTDFIGACGWIHTPELDRGEAEPFVRKVISMTDENGWDFIKLMSNGWYTMEAYGEKLTFYEREIPLEYQKIKRLADVRENLIQNEGDLETLPVLHAEENRVIGYNAEVIRRITAHYQGSIPLVGTIFTPSTLLPDLCGGNERFLQYLEECPDKVHKALEALLQTDMNIADAFLNAGAAGLFISTKHSSPAMMPEKYFEEFCQSYEERLIAHLKGKSWFNILHVHGQRDMYMEKYARYDVQAINWENIPHGLSGKGITSVADLRAMTDKILIGGTDQFYDFYGTQQEVLSRFRQRVKNAAAESGDNRFIFAPGCSLPLDVDPGNIHQLRVAADEYNAGPQYQRIRRQA